MLLYLALAQALGVALADRGWLSLRGSLALGLSSLAVGIVARRRSSVCAVCACAAALCAGALALDVQRSSSRADRLSHPAERIFEGTVRETRFGGSMVFAVLDGVTAVDGRGPIPRRVSVAGELPSVGWAGGAGEFGLERADPGDRLRVRARLRAPRSESNPGGRDQAREFERAGIGAVGSVDRSVCCVRLPEREGARWLSFLWRLRRKAGERLAQLGDDGALLRALALGDRRGLSDTARDAFSRLGLTHLLAVSGLHLSLVASLGFSVARRVLRRSAALAARRGVDGFALGFGGALALAYAFISGWGVPVQRALIFLAALVLATAFGRSGARFHPLAVASMVVLSREPAALFSAGAQLSFAACAALLAAGAFPPSDREQGGATTRVISGPLRISAVAIAATAPFAAWHMGRVAPFALVSNLVAIPWTAGVLLPVSLGAAMLAMLPDHPVCRGGLEAASIIARGTQLGVESVARHVPAIRAAPSPAPVYVGFALALGCGVVRARRTTLRVVLVLFECAVLAVAPASSLAPPAPRALVFDVGQGDAMLIQGRRAAVLIDAGSAIPGRFDRGRARVVPALRAAGVRRLDLLLATHADLDHRGGIPAVLDAIPVSVVWMPFGAAEDDGFAPVFAAARRHGVRVVERGQGSLPFRVGDLAIVPLWPPSAASAGASRNDRSLVVRAEFGGVEILLAGDLERVGEGALLASGADLRADVLALPHHGSRSSSTAAFLEAVGASIALVSAPCFGRFGMPHPEVVSRAERAGLTIWWTGRDGALWITPFERLADMRAMRNSNPIPNQNPRRETEARARSVGLAVWGHALDGPRCTVDASALNSKSPAHRSRYVPELFKQVK